MWTRNIPSSGSDDSTSIPRAVRLAISPSVTRALTSTTTWPSAAYGKSVSATSTPVAIGWPPSIRNSAINCESIFCSASDRTSFSWISASICSSASGEISASAVCADGG